MKKQSQANGILFSFLRLDQIVEKAEEVENQTRSTLPDQRIAELILYPESILEIQKIVEIANQNNLHLWYVSTGKNWGYGCKSAPYSGGVTLILERMKKIYEVNTELGYAVIEPGVTYEDLHHHLENNNLKLWTDSAGTTKTASIIGNALDKGRGLTPYADHFGMLCGLDVILPDGKYLETTPHKKFHCKHTYKWSVGPYIDGLFTQSNFGIVVKAGIWLMPIPEKFEFFAFEYKAQAHQFEAFIDDFKKLFFSQGLLSRPHLANDFAMLCIVDSYPKKSNTSIEKTLSPTELKNWKKSHGIKDWTFGGGLYGTKKQIQAQKELVKRYLSTYGTIRFLGDGRQDTLYSKIFRKLVLLGAKLDGKSDSFINQIFPAIDLFRGKPTDDFAKQVYFKSLIQRPLNSFTPALDNLGFIWIGPLVPFSSFHIKTVLEIAKPVFKEYQFDFFVELIVESPRTMISLFGIFFEPNNEEESQRAKGWYKSIHDKMENAGYSPYRETSQSSIYALQGNPELKEMLSKIRGALDAKGILAPHKYGIS